MIRNALGRGVLALCLTLLVASACAAKDVGQVISLKLVLQRSVAGRLWSWA